MLDKLAFLDAVAQADLVRRGEITPSALVDAALARIERVNPKLNAVIIPLFEKARAQAAAPDLPRGPFRGVPFLLKDLLAYSAGDPHHMGTRRLKQAGFVAPHDSNTAARLRAAGFVFLGKTNTPEIGTLPTTEPDAYGPTRNPWDPSRSTGGSSGGSAASVAAGLVPAAHANDGGGSIRIPASECGLVGLKPSRGRVSFGPDLGEPIAGLAHEGVVTRSVRDTAALLDILAGYEPGDPHTAPPPLRPYAQEVGTDPGKLRIGILVRLPGETAPTHPDCRAAAESAARLLESLGHTVEPSHPAALDELEVGHHFSMMYATHIARMVDVLGELTGTPFGPDDLDPLNRTLADLGRMATSQQYLATVDWLHGYTRRMAAWWTSGFDLLLTPTLPQPPPPLGTFTPSAADPVATGVRATQFAGFTMPFNLTGQPAMSLPLHWNDDGLPIGVQFAAAYGREDLLIRVAAQLEQARSWADRRPPIHA